MSLFEKYKKYFNIDPEYFPAVNEKLINDNPNLWKTFYPHKTFVKLLKDTLNALDRRKKLSIWVEGAYGTGKSHAVLTIKKLLEAGDADTAEYFEKFDLDRDILNNLQRVKNSGKILTVHRYGSSRIHGDDDLVLAIQESIEKALSDAGIENKASASLRSSVIKYLSDDENKRSFNIYAGGSYKNLFGGDMADDIIRKLNEYTGSALQTLMTKLFKYGKGHPIFSMDTTALADWIREVISANNLKAVVFIWDEFTEYFYNNSRSLTGFQELCEISESDPFYFMLVTHVSSGLFSDRDPDFKKINDRFINPHSAISLPENIAFELMGAAMVKNSEKTVKESWEEIMDDLSDRTLTTRMLVKKIINIEDKYLKAILPIHPYAALLLKQISSAFESNQRSMFDFIKSDQGDEIRGFQWFIDNYGPEDDNPLLTVDMLWDFFYERGRDSLAQDIRSVLDYYVRAERKIVDDDEKRVLKTILLLQAISIHAGEDIDLFIPNAENLNRAFEGTDIEDDAESCAEKLVRDKVIFKKDLGNNKFQYNTFATEVDSKEIESYIKEIDKKSTTMLITEELVDRTTVANAVELSDALKLRYKLDYASAADFESKIRSIRSRDASDNTIAALLCFAKDDDESFAINKKIQKALSDETCDLVFIDASITPLGTDDYEQYRKNMAQSMYQSNKDRELSREYAKNARDFLSRWKGRINSGSFMVYSLQRLDGERAVTIDELYQIMGSITKYKYPQCLEGTYNVLPTMYQRTSLKLGVECGAMQKTRQTYSSGNVKTKLETALDGAWNIDRYWEVKPNLPISKMKIYVEEVIGKAFNEFGRISIHDIYDSLKQPPYGILPCNFTAFILGFLLKEYINGSYSWRDELTTESLNLNKLQEMIEEVIKLQITPNPRYKDKYIVAMTDEEKKFNEATANAFGIPIDLCSDVTNTGLRVREKMNELPFPIWTLKSLLPTLETKTDKLVLEKLIDCYCGVANSNNLSGARSSQDIAFEIGELCIKNPDASEDLKGMLNEDNCKIGMEKYIESLDGGELIKLSNEIKDNGNYINVIRDKFDAKEANWVWNMETAKQKIREVILDYKIVAASNKVISPNNSYQGIVEDWLDKCNYIRISYKAAKRYMGELEPFMEMLYNIKTNRTLHDSQKENFLDLLSKYGNSFRSFYDNQIDMFKRVCEYHLDGLSDDEIKAVFDKIPSRMFALERAEYLNSVEKSVTEFKNSLGIERLKKLWRDKTGTSTPKEWSKEHRMPILCVVPATEFKEADMAFRTVSLKHPSSQRTDMAIKYLENAKFYDVLNNEKELDRLFTKKIIKNYSVILTDIPRVKSYLVNKIGNDPYEWMILPDVEDKLKVMAEAQYAQSDYAKAFEKIDQMAADEVKKYLKDLIVDNINVGMEIIKNN